LQADAARRDREAVRQRNDGRRRSDPESVGTATIVKLGDRRRVRIA